MTRDEAHRLTRKLFSYSRAEECTASVEVRFRSHTRFAVNEITTSGATRDVLVRVTVKGGGRRARVQVNGTDEGALRRAVARADALLALAPPDPELVPDLERQAYPEIPAFDEATARAGAAERAQAIRGAIEVARERGVVAAGILTTRTSFVAFANKRGNADHFASTRVWCSNTARTRDGTGSGWAGFAGRRLADLRTGDLAARAAEKALASAKPRELPPGRYTVVLEPAAVQDLLERLPGAFAARRAEEGRSFLSKKGGGTRLGEKVFAESVTLRSDPFDPRVLGRPWAAEMLPARRTTWIERGRVRELAVDRYWAKRTGRTPLPVSPGLVLEGGSGTTQDLVAAMERGLLVTRFWYIRTVNPFNLELTGLTRDGVWLVEGGKVVAPVNNLRFNDGPVGLLRRLEALGASVPALGMVVPPLRSRDFLFTSKSDAV
jgi:predicted Zn-dependent protease